jgi:hypothetical protein
MESFDGVCSTVPSDAPEKVAERKRMERSKSLELHLTEVELEALISAVNKISDSGFAELEFKLRAAWRRGYPQSDYRSVTPDVG